MLGDSLCQRCQWRESWLDARDMYYQAAFSYGEKEALLKRELEAAEVHLERAKALDERVQNNLKLLNELTEDLKAEMARSEPKKPWWRRLFKR